MTVTVGHDHSRTRKSLTAGGQTVSYYSIPAAEAAGLRRGDVIEAIDGVDVGDQRQLVRLVRARRPGDRIVVRVRRAGETIEVVVILGEAAAR